MNTSRVPAATEAVPPDVSALRHRHVSHLDPILTTVKPPNDRVASNPSSMRDSSPRVLLVLRRKIVTKSLFNYSRSLAYTALLRLCFHQRQPLSFSGSLFCTYPLCEPRWINHGTKIETSELGGTPVLSVCSRAAAGLVYPSIRRQLGMNLCSASFPGPLDTHEDTVYYTNQP